MSKTTNTSPEHTSSRLTQLKNEAGIGFILYTVIVVLVAGIQIFGPYGVLAGEISYTFGFPTWFIANISVYIISFVILVYIVRNYMANIDLEPPTESIPESAPITETNERQTVSRQRSDR